MVCARITAETDAEMKGAINALRDAFPGINRQVAMESAIQYWLAAMRAEHNGGRPFEHFEGRLEHPQGFEQDE